MGKGGLAALAYLVRGSGGRPFFDATAGATGGEDERNRIPMGLRAAPETEQYLARSFHLHRPTHATTSLLGIQSSHLCDSLRCN